MQNFTLVALVESLAATLLLGLFLLPPGYLVGRASNLFHFREASGSEKVLLSLVLSMAVTPVGAVLLGRYFGLVVTVFLFLIAAVAATACSLLDLRKGPDRSLDRSTKIALWLMAAWTLLALLSIVDWQNGNRLYVSAVIYDHSVRVPFVGAVLRDGVPPHNPFFNLNGSPVLRYYYFWYVVAALPGKLASLSPRACLNASIVWCGFALAATVPLFLKHFLQDTSQLRRKSLAGILLLLVTGLDLLPYLWITLRAHIILADTEWWDPNQVTSWIGSLLWVPHHVAALIACVTGLLLLSQTGQSSAQRLWTIVLAALAFASGAGLSLYVTFTFVVFCVLWMAVLLFQRQTQEFLNWLAASALALLFAAPYLHDLLTGTSGAGTRFAVFALRDFPLAIDLLRMLGVQNGALLDFAKLPIIVLVYFLEFGFFFCVALLQFKRDLLGDAALSSSRRAAWLLSASCLFVVTIFQSDTTGSNDLGFRGILPAQFILLLWAASFVYDLFAKNPPPLAMLSRAALYTTLVIGLLSTGVQLVLLRGFAILVDVGKVKPMESYLQISDLGRHTYSLRHGFSELDRRSGKGDIYQFAPDSRAAWLIRLYSGHPFAAGDESCGTTFGGDPSRCSEAMGSLIAPFRATFPPSEIEQTCSRFGVRLLVVTDQDPVWQDRTSWVWQINPIVANDVLRAFTCGRSR